MIRKVPATGERIDALLIEDGCGMLCLKVGRRTGLIDYALKGVLDIGWRIIDSTPDERALLDAHGVNIAP
jgi:hypothetical protein